MPKKKKKKRFRAVEAVKAMAREKIGSPPASRIVQDGKKKPDKHRLTLQELLDEQ